MEDNKSASSETEAETKKEEKSYETKKAASLCKWVLILLFADLLLYIVALIDNNVYLAMLQDLKAGVQYTDAELDTYDSRTAWITWLQNIAFLITSFVFLRWTHRMANNALASRRNAVSYTPAKSVWSYFVPIYNFWVPVRILKDIKNSFDPHFYSGVAGLVCPVWWTAWWLSNVLGRIVLRRKQAENIDQLIDHTELDILVSVSDIILTFFALAVVGIVIGAWRNYSADNKPATVDGVSVAENHFPNM